MPGDICTGAQFCFAAGSFFASGGIYSGSFLFFLLGLTLCAILLKGNFGGIVFVISITVMELAITLSTAFPQYVQEVTVKQHSRSVVSMLLLASLALYSIVLLILRSYREERTQNEMLMQKMHELSVTDVLCGLYNRRELFRRLEIMYGSRDERERKEQLVISNRYIAMFDVDDFKKLNDTYGHSFGDTVLVSIAKVLDDMTVP